jgi:hypothetical protein
MDRAYWQLQLEEAERELDAAKGRTAINRASKHLQEARRELKRLDEEAVKRPKGATATRARRPASA